MPIPRKDFEDSDAALKEEYAAISDRLKDALFDSPAPAWPR